MPPSRSRTQTVVWTTEDFHHWLLARRAEWQAFKAKEGSLLTFTDYITAQALFLEEIKNG